MVESGVLDSVLGSEPRARHGADAKRSRRTQVMLRRCRVEQSLSLPVLTQLCLFHTRRAIDMWVAEFGQGQV